MGGFEFIVFFLVFGSILFLAYAATRYIGNKSGKALKGKYIHVVESVSIGMDKQLHLVEIAGQYILISSSGKSIEFLTQVDMEGNLPELEKDTANTMDFKWVLEKYLPGFKAGKKKEEIAGESDFKETGYSGHSTAFNSNLNRLKNITSKVERVTENHENEDADQS